MRFSINNSCIADNEFFMKMIKVIYVFVKYVELGLFLYEHIKQDNALVASINVVSALHMPTNILPVKIAPPFFPLHILNV